MSGAPLPELLLPAKSTAEFRTGSWGGGTRAHPVHGLKCGAEAVLGSRWRLQTAQPAFILLLSCLQPWDRARQQPPAGVGSWLSPAIAGG